MRTSIIDSIQHEDWMTGGYRSEWMNCQSCISLRIMLPQLLGSIAKKVGYLSILHAQSQTVCQTDRGCDWIFLLLKSHLADQSS